MHMTTINEIIGQKFDTEQGSRYMEQFGGGKRKKMIQLYYD